MDVNQDKIDDAVLALMYLGIHEGVRTWKSFDWGALDRLYEKGLIADPKSRAKSILLTDEGLERSKRLFTAMFASGD